MQRIECSHCGMAINLKLKPNTGDRSLAYKLPKSKQHPIHKACDGKWFYGRTDYSRS